MFGIELNLGRLEKAEPVPLKPFIGPERPRSSDGLVESVFPRSPRSKSLRGDFDRGVGWPRLLPFLRWLLSCRSSPVVPVVADRPGSFPETVFLVFGNRVAGRSHSR